MNRRTALRRVVIISTGAALLPSCAIKDRSTVPLKNISITGSQEKMLTELAETIIPETRNFIGAKKLKASEFMLTMVDDCASPGDQEKFMEGVKGFDKYCKAEIGKSFNECTPVQRQTLLKDIESKKNIPENILDFYQTVKRYTVESFTSSRDFMTSIRKYNMVPGPRFKGCVPATNA